MYSLFQAVLNVIHLFHLFPVHYQVFIQKQ